MHELIAWAGFFGAWLLVAGPVYQMSQELREEEFERERVAELQRSLPTEPPVSPWWWLVPPVRLYLSRKRAEQRQRAMLMALEEDDYRAMLSFMNKATGWLMVAAGGLLIATKESYELIEVEEWPAWLLAALVPLGLVLAVGYTVFRSIRERQVDLRRDASKAPEPDA